MPAKGSLLYDTFVLNQSVGALLGRALLPAPLSPDEYAIYSHIFEFDRCTPSEMARNLSMPLQTVSDWVSLLRKRGHLTSTTNDQDRRSYRISLTDEGLRVQRETHVYFDRAYRLFIKGLGRSEREMRTYVQQLTEAVLTAAAAIERELASA